MRLLMIGALHPVRVPSPSEEGVRDLVRAREDVRGELMRARHRLSKLLLRMTCALTAPPEAAIGELLPDSPWAETAARLRCLRGIDTLTAVGLCAEVSDFTRFARAGQLMSFLGLVPSEHSSGQTRRQGQITKSGSRHGAVGRSGVLKQQAPRKGEWRVGGAWRAVIGPVRGSRSRCRLAGTPTVTVEDQARPRPEPVIGDRFAACGSAVHRGVRQLTVAWGRPAGAPPRTRQLDRALLVEKGHHGRNRSRTFSHCLRGPELAGLPARGREGE